MLEIIVTYRHTSRLSMRIGKRGEVRVSAPYGIHKIEVEHFIDEHLEWIKKALEMTCIRFEKREMFFGKLSLRTQAEKNDAAERLNTIIMPMVERYSTQMGVRPTAITYRATISKWGSCQIRSRSIQFSLYLLLLPEFCIEHVVVHELAHLLVSNHSAKFYNIMDKHFPRWQEARQETKRISSMETLE